VQLVYLIYIVIIICILCTCATIGFLAIQSCNLCFYFARIFVLLSLFSCVYCLKIHRDLKAVPASLLRWLTAWIDLVGSIGFIDLKNNSARVLMRLIMSSFLTQV